MPSVGPYARSVSAGHSSVSSTLLDGLRACDRGAWERLVGAFGRVIYEWARKQGLQRNDAADVVQEVLTSVVSHIHAFRRDKPSDTFRGWVWTITRNKVRDFGRRAKNRPFAVGGSDMQEQIHAVPESECESSDGLSVADANCLLMREVLARIRNDFDAKTWQAFWLTTVEGEKSPDVAERLGMKKGAVRAAKFRVMKRVREEFEGMA